MENIEEKIEILLRKNLIRKPFILARLLKKYDGNVDQIEMFLNKKKGKGCFFKELYSKGDEPVEKEQ